MAATTTTNTARKAALVLLTLLALLPPIILGARTGPPPSSPHHSQGHKRSPPPPPPPATPPPAATTIAGELVRTTCNSTTYYDLCMSTLAADPTSSTADLQGLSSISISAAATNASGGAATAVALATTGGGGNGNTTATSAAAVDGGATQPALLRTCAAKYGEARDALTAARDAVARRDYDFAAVHVSAAAEYPRVCRVLFQRQSRPAAAAEYPPELAAREEALRRLCTVALDIIALLSNNTN